MIDFPLDLAVNSGITAAVVGVFLLLPPGWLLTPSLRQRLFTGALLGLASVVAMPDLLKQATQAQALAANPTPLIGAALLYLALLLPLVRLVGHFEARHREATR